MKIKNIDALELSKVIEGILVGNVPMPSKFLYALERNKNKIKPIAMSVQAVYSATPSKAVAEYEKERVKLCVSNSKKDKAGKPIIITDPATRQGQYDIVDRVKFDKDLLGLLKAHPQAQKDGEVRQDEINAILHEETDVDFYQIGPEFLPDTLSPRSSGFIFRFIIKKSAEELAEEKADKEAIKDAEKKSVPEKADKDPGKDKKISKKVDKK